MSALKDLQDLLHLALVADSQVAQVVRFNVKEIAASTAQVLARPEYADRLVDVATRLAKEVHAQDNVAS